MHRAAGLRFAALVVIVLTLSAASVHADVRIEVGMAVPNGQGKLVVDVILASGGESIGGFQNDIVFDNRVVRLDSEADCRINPAIGAFPLGNGEGTMVCADDPTIGPCKTLVRNLTTCADEQAPKGCPTEDPGYSRLRAIVVAFEVPNTNSIPDGVAYTCTFSVVEPGLLPVRLFNTNVVVSDPFGKRLASRGEDGNVCVDEEGLRTCAPLRELDERCALDFECASGHCDVCCDHQFNGICAAPRTPTPMATVTPTRSRAPTRTATATRPPSATPTASLSPTVTNTPTPKSIGDRCNRVDECASNLSCNRTDGGVCCTSVRCPDGMACNVSGFAGYCVRGETPTPVVQGEVVIEVGSATADDDGYAEVAVSLHPRGFSIGGMQNDILFDNTIVALDSADCRIATAIGLFPQGEQATSCFDDSSIGPCKNHFKAVEQCGADPLPPMCSSAAPNLSAVRNIVAATAVPNNNVIPQGPVYTCRFRVLDAARLPLLLHNMNVVVSTPLGIRISATGISGRIDPAPAPPGSDGAECSAAAECDSRNCVDGVCCSQRSCGTNESCAVSGSRGDCAPLRLQGEGCDLGADCERGNCDLHRDSAASTFRGACGASRASSTPLPRECSRGRDCDSGNCVDGFCCDVDECAAGQFCNSGQCAMPAEPGAPCTADEQCALGLCVDGACCVTGSCSEGKSCNVPTLEGICREPFGLGSPCTLDEQCPTGFCTSGVCCRSEDCPTGSVCSRFSAPGECIGIGSEPGKPDAEDSATPTPLAPGVPTAEATRTLPGSTPPPTFASQPTASATAVGNPVGSAGDDDDGCSMTPRNSGNGLCWPAAFTALLFYARRRARGCST